MRTAVVQLLVVSFVLGALASSMDVHALAPAADPTVTAHHAAGHAADPDGDASHYEHCGHVNAHFTGLPVTALAPAFHADQPDWPLTTVAHLSLTYTPPTPPPNR